jgi:hypothetical protein
MFSALQSLAWAYPALEAVHVVGIALLLGNLVALEFRVFGRAAAGWRATRPAGSRTSASHSPPPA